MWIWIGIISCIIIFGVVIARSYIDIKILCNKVQEDDYISIKAKMLFGLVKFNYQIRQISFKGFEQGFLVKREQKDNFLAGHKTRDKFEFDFHYLQKMYDRVNLLVKYTPDLIRWTKKILRHVHCSILTWETHIGMEDAADTAVASGAMWAIKGTATGWLSHLIRLQHQPEIQVHTHFHGPQFTTEFRCIAKIRFGHAMVAGVILLVRVVKVKGGLKLWQSILFKA
ncbi:DUF2953 domain-containing protein [Paenibacillus selenitireducens]|nr:DUF2953 domain-containing protein [Paenibacillus selenitireducens]